MGHYQETFDLDVPVQEVWDLMMDPDRLTEWLAIDEVRDVGGRLDEVGVSYILVVRLAGFRLKGRWEITGVDPLRLREFVGTPPGCSVVKGRDRFAAVDGRTELTVELDYQVWGGPLGKVADRMFGRALVARIVRKNVAGLKRLLE